MTTQIKQCIKCKQIKNATCFYREARVHDGLTARCKDCMKADAGQSYADRKDEVLNRIRRNYSTRKAKEVTLRINYGMTIEEWTDMLEKQDHSCAICKSKDSRHGAGMFVVDHCHAKLHVRGLLCGPCNAMLGLAQDSPSTLASAIEYLEQHKDGIPIPERRKRLGVATNVTKSMENALRDDLAIVDDLVKEEKDWAYIARVLNEIKIPTATGSGLWRGHVVKKVFHLRQLHRE